MDTWPEEFSIRRLTLLGKLPTVCAPLRKHPQVAVLLRINQEAMKSLTEGNLEDCLLSEVDLRRQRISQTVEEVQKVVHQLTIEISHQDIRFQAVPYSDMYNENIKVLAPSQFLVTVPVRGLAGYREARGQRWRYYTLQGGRLPCPLQAPEALQQWLEVEQFVKSLWQWRESDVNIEGDIVPAKVLQVFRKLVENAIRTCHLSGKVSMLANRSAVWVAVETCVCPVELELAPAVEIPTTWSEKARWPRCLKRWPSPERVECIKSFGFNLLARSNYHWQLSFLQAEQVLLEQLDEDGGCRRKCFQVMRQLKEDVWCPGKRPVLTSHHLQTVLFWTCEKYPHSKDWQTFHKAFLRLVRKLHKCVSQHFLKHYFVPNSNLLQYVNSGELEAVAQKLAFFLKDPQVSLP
ncbi:protein mab-21-like 3 isoform X1 [Nycticebus coucang]|uniref:protein mab-21-like 3 isoform X1 n=1 Tax=Nycticebus coucang TaxID=9470 RepID=UPI00234CE032|nr:protein mab-21-like 3 isoform X1 [Nycticebus coucang]XP_053447346.1 protein mab-21-like 3 isoform X1 [Nycticebus coucang]XP_053447347.1 protein mab-21-like 3 isoform X1 [Nycticebus coucang]XP_053447349.1 protein mab-21-like 3 isoform X1 [Nycticebus coucang]XP_053447350.1 protein mab-21-like 3 isoform X1 [Nycticebus coucang]XP_053447351.1 protein mab-21-like 3 isoform X1 [Nycticebus coucang]